MYNQGPPGHMGGGYGPPGHMGGGFGGPPGHMGGGFGGPPGHMGGGFGGPPGHMGGGFGGAGQMGGGSRSVQIQLISGHDMPKRSGMFDKTDPFVVVTCGGQSQRSNTIKDAGSRCTWNETMILRYTSDPQLIFSLYDEDPGKGESLLGSGSLNLQQHLQGGRYSGEIHCVDERNKPRGTLTVDVVLQ